MLITSEPKTMKVRNLIFRFVGGDILDVDLYEELGDSMDWDTHKDAFVVNLSERKNDDLAFFRSAETITIFKDKIISITNIVREEMERTPEQEALIRQTIQEMSSKSIN